MSLAAGFPTLWTATFDGVEQVHHGWAALELNKLRPQTHKRGSNLTVPGVANRRPRRRLPDERTETVEYLFDGNYDPVTGDFVGDPESQLQDTIDLFLDTVVNHDEESIDCVLSGPNGRTYTGPIQVERFRLGAGDITAVAVVSVVLLGELAPSGS